MTEELERRLAAAVAALKEAGATEVYLFGSVAEGTDDEHSDVDLAVSGLPPKEFFRAMGRAAGLLGRPVSLVDLDEDGPFVRRLRRRKGVRRVG